MVAAALTRSDARRWQILHKQFAPLCSGCLWMHATKFGPRTQVGRVCTPTKIFQHLLHLKSSM